MHETALSADDFAGFYEAVHGDPPWDWQQRLAAEVLAAADARGDRERLWPDVIDAPTGAGKTSVADIAVFALAARPGVFPRRIVWVINRRIVVDEVYEHVERINNRLREAETGPERAVADSLRAMAGPGGGDLIGTSALRGGKILADDWARHPPDRPWVAVSTIDQYGSRLLHRGYGVSPRTRSVHAGLAGNDCLVILDEMHTSGPLHDTIRGVRDADERHAGPDRVRLPRRFEVVRMSATPGAVGPDCKTFTLSKAERAQPGLRQRLRSKIDAKLVPAPKGLKGAQAGYREKRRRYRRGPRAHGQSGPRGAGRTRRDAGRRSGRGGPQHGGRRPGGPPPGRGGRLHGASAHGPDAPAGQSRRRGQHHPRRPHPPRAAAGRQGRRDETGGGGVDPVDRDRCRLRLRRDDHRMRPGGQPPAAVRQAGPERRLHEAVRRPEPAGVDHRRQSRPDLPAGPTRPGRR